MKRSVLAGKVREPRHRVLYRRPRGVSKRRSFHRGASGTGTVSNLPTHSSLDTEAAGKLRQTRAEYSAARPAREPYRKMLSSVKMYVCRRCQSNFKTGEGMPDARISGLRKCNVCQMIARAPRRGNPKHLAVSLPQVVQPGSAAGRRR